MSWAKMFKNPYQAATFGPPGSSRRTCAKCGDHMSVGPRYDKGRDMLRHRCHSCGYEWEEVPHDRKQAEHLAKLVADNGDAAK